MAPDPFLEEELRLLTPEAFEFVLANELKRAVRSQNYVTLLLLDPVARPVNAVRSEQARQLARLVSREVRETDLLSQNADGRLSIVLLDADDRSAMRVVERLMSRLEHYEFSPPLTVDVGAASCPTHGTDPETLRRAAENRLVRTRRETRGNASNAH